MNNQGDCFGNVETRSWRPKWRRFWWGVWGYFFGDVPNNHKSTTIQYLINKRGKKEKLHVAMFCNDAFDICIGYPNQWRICLRRKALCRLIFWYLWLFAYGEWFGLRRYLYYKFLYRRCKRIKKFGKTF